jgi:hypothetical protein
MAQTMKNGLGIDVVWAAQANGLLPACTRPAHAFTPRHDQRQRAGPKRQHERTRKCRNVGCEMVCA